MLNGEEYTHVFIPNVDDGLDDKDADRYPNVFELRRSGDPSSAASLPTANYVVDPAGGGTHTTISAAITAANVANGAFQIIAIQPATYTGSSNLGHPSTRSGREVQVGLTPVTSAWSSRLCTQLRLGASLVGCATSRHARGQQPHRRGLPDVQRWR
jgi:pectin methylesterase-like acyl-CoA thioesterase